MRSVARRYQQLSEEIAELEEQIARLVSEAVPALTLLRGVGTDTAASLLLAVGDNPQRLKSEASFARLCGVAPPLRPLRARRPVIALTAEATGKPTEPYTCWPWDG